MIESKRFAFFMVIVIALVLTISNWATPAQATSTGMIDVTPTPTRTPVGEPDALGETPSVEQQEELKSIVQSYFEIRYSSLSITQPDD